MRRAAVASLLAVSVLVPGAASAAPRVLAGGPTLTKAAAYGQTLAFSERVGENRFALVALDLGTGAERRVPVPVRRVPFDVDLGPGVGGATTAVYSRCRREPSLASATADGEPLDYTHGHGCALYAVALAGGRERRLRGLDRAGASEMLPSVWGDRVAFLRRSEADGERLQLVVGSLRRTLRVLPVPRAGSASDAVASDGLDLRGGRVAFEWTRYPDSCPVRTAPPSDLVMPTYSEVYVSDATRSAAPARIAQACTEDAARTRLAGVAQTATGVVFGREAIREQDRPFAWDVVEATRSTGAESVLATMAFSDLHLHYVSVAASGPIVTVEDIPYGGPFGGTKILAVP